MFYEDDNRMYTGRTDGHSGGYLWFAFLIFIIFAIFAFVFLRDNKKHDGVEAIAGIAAIKAADGFGGGGNKHGMDTYMWDHARDDLKEFGEIKKEIVVQTLGQSREMDSKFHEVLRKQCEDTASIKAEMNQKFFELAKENWKIENDRLKEQLLLKEIHCPKPMYAYSPPASVQTPPLQSYYGNPCYA